MRKYLHPGRPKKNADPHDFEYPSSYASDWNVEYDSDLANWMRQELKKRYPDDPIKQRDMMLSEGIPKAERHTRAFTELSQPHPEAIESKYQIHPNTAISDYAVPMSDRGECTAWIVKDTLDEIHKLEVRYMKYFIALMKMRMKGQHHKSKSKRKNK